MNCIYTKRSRFPCARRAKLIQLGKLLVISIFTRASLQANKLLFTNLWLVFFLQFIHSNHLFHTFAVSMKQINKLFFTHFLYRYL